MRGTWIAILMLGAGLATTPVRAGVYISAEVRPDLMDLHQIKLLRGTLQSVALPPKGTDAEKHRYLKVVSELESREKAGQLTALDRADLGGCYLRLDRPREALRALTAGDGNHFLVLCNLAVTYHTLAVLDQDVNRLEEAILTQRKALKAWPASWLGLTREQLAFYRRVERLQLRLLEARFREQKKNDGKTLAWQAVDDIFPGVRFVGPSGEYEAGSIALAVVDELPPDAPWLVRELMMAYPTDIRLYWLFAELLNARGQVEDALEITNDLVNANQASGVRELMAHRRVLKERADLLRDLRASALFQTEALPPLTVANLFWSLAPRAPLPGAGAAAAEAGWWATTAAIEELQRQERIGRKVEVAPPDLPTADAAPGGPPSRGAWLPDWRPLVVGFVAGAVVALVARLQWREWQRGRQPAPTQRRPLAG